MPTGIRIKEIRQKKGLTQKQLGDMCGIADANIRKYENGKQNPKIETLQKIADALGVSLHELLYSDELIELDGIPAYNIDLTGYSMDEIQQALEKIQNDLKAKRKENTTLLSKLQPEDSVTVTDIKEQKLLSDYRQLNDEGKTQAIIRVEELTEVPRFTAKEIESLNNYNAFVKDKPSEYWKKLAESLQKKSSCDTNTNNKSEHNQ